MARTEKRRLRNKKSESGVADIFPNNRMPVGCTAQSEFKIAAKRQRDVDNDISDGQMPAKRTVQPAPQGHAAILEREEETHFLEIMEREDGVNLEHDGPFDNERDREAGDTDLMAKIARISNVASNFTASLQKSVAPFPGAQHLQSAAVSNAVPQQGPESSNEAFSGPVMTESAVFGQNTESVAARDAPISCLEQTQTHISYPCVASSGNRSKDEVCRSTILQSTLKKRREDNHELQTVLPARSNVSLSKSVGKDIEELTNTNTGPDARIQELEDYVVAQALKLVSQAKEIKSLVETVNELRARIHEL
ncbi:hypothetical protein BDV10DRAFT_188416 [Aspergillus recurvatus]